MSNLPKGWSDLKLGDICEFTQGVQIPFSEQIQEYKEGYIRYLYIRDFFSDKDKCYVEDIYPHKIMRKEDIMIVNTGNTAGSVYSGAEGVLSNNAFKLNFDSNNLNRDFLFQFLKSYIFDTYIKKLFNSAGQPHVGHKNIALVPIKLPPLEEQKKIADILTTVDKKIAFVEENINATEELKKGLMQKLLTEGIGHTEFKDSELGRIPESWEIDILENHIQIISGQSPSNFDLEGQTYKFFKVNQLNFCAKYLFESEYAYDYSSYKNFNKGTIIFPKRGAAIFTNKVRILDTEGYIDTNLMGLVTKETINNEFLYYWLVSFELSNIADTSSIPQINNKHINPLKIAMPQLDEQILISDILINVDNKLEILKQKKQSFEELKKGLMQKLLTGEVSV